MLHRRRSVAIQKPASAPGMMETIKYQRYPRRCASSRPRLETFRAKTNERLEFEQTGKSCKTLPRLPESPFCAHQKTSRQCGLSLPRPIKFDWNPVCQRPKYLIKWLPRPHLIPTEVLSGLADGLTTNSATFDKLPPGVCYWRSGQTLQRKREAF